MQGVLERNQEMQVLGIVEAAAVEHVLDPVDAAVRQKDIAAMLVAGEIRLGGQLARDRRHLPQTDAGLVDVPRNHEGDPRLVDQDRVGLIDQRELEGTVH